jgi:hypothetical protein
MQHVLAVEFVEKEIAASGPASSVPRISPYHAAPINANQLTVHVKHLRGLEVVRKGTTNPDFGNVV